MKTWHLTWSTEGRLVAFPSEAERRWAVRTLVRIGGARVLVFCVVDDHVHAVVYTTREDVGRLARAVQLALSTRAAAPLGRADVRHVDNRAYQLTVIRYVLGQPARHGLVEHPAAWSGSAFQDLVGARFIAGWDPPFAEALPRWRLEAAYEAVGLGPTPIEPVADTALPAFGLDRLVAAAAAATGAAPGLAGREAPVVQARRVAVALLRRAGLPPAGIRAQLGLAPSGERWLAARPTPPAAERAARLRLALELRVGEALVRPTSPRPHPENAAAVPPPP